MIHYHNIEQGTMEWFTLRERKLTGSNATPIGANGKGLKTYCQEIAIDLVALTREDRFANSVMDNGTELEPIAVIAYEFETKTNTEIVGFVTNDEFMNVGVSPDRLIGTNGGLEIKIRNNKKHFALIQGETAEIPFNQIQMCLLVTGREWWDFASYNPNFEKHIFIKRIYPDVKYFDKLRKGFTEGNILITEYLETYKNYKNIQIK